MPASRNQPAPRFEKGDQVIARVKTCGRDMIFSCRILDPQWNGHHYIYLVEDVLSGCALLVPEDQLTQEAAPCLSPA